MHGIMLLRKINCNHAHKIYYNKCPSDVEEIARRRRNNITYNTRSIQEISKVLFDKYVQGYILIYCFSVLFLFFIPTTSANKFILLFFFYIRLQKLKEPLGNKPNAFKGLSLADITLVFLLMYNFTHFIIYL